MIKGSIWLTLFHISKEAINLFGDISKKQVKSLEYTINASVGDVVIIKTTFTNIISKEDYRKIGIFMQSDMEKRMSDKNFEEMTNNQPISEDK